MNKMASGDDDRAFTMDSVNMLKRMEAQAEALIDAKAQLINLVDSHKETQAALSSLDLALNKTYPYKPLPLSKFE